MKCRWSLDGSSNASTSPSKKLQWCSTPLKPFVFDGKSYISFLVLKAIHTGHPAPEKDKAEVWIASSSIRKDELLRKVSGAERIKRSDPEYLVTEDEVFVYYTEIRRKFASSSIA